MESKAGSLILHSDELRALQLKSLEMALYFKEFCEEHGLLFYFCGGCCIGAVRNGGFIPWDDDIDIFMPREDYEKLGPLWSEFADTGRYAYVRPGKGYYTAKVITNIVDKRTTLIKPEQKDLDIPHGVVLDVFPIDGCPRGYFKRKRQLFFAYIYSLYTAHLIPKNHGRWVAMGSKFLLSLLPSREMRCRISRYAERKMSQYAMAACEEVTELCAGPHYMKNRYPKEAFLSAVYRPFEGYEMPLPVGYDAYLRIAFGDYMKEPTEDKRVAHHDIMFMDLEHGYEELREETKQGREKT